MKRTVLIVLTMIYLLSCSGIAVDRFYCCGKLASVDLAYAAPEHQDIRTDVKDKCCKHVNQNFKVKDSHVSAPAFLLHSPIPVILPSFTGLDHFALIKALPLSQPYQSHAPPLHPDIPIYTLNCTYRI